MGEEVKFEDIEKVWHGPGESDLGNQVWLLGHTKGTFFCIWPYDQNDSPFTFMAPILKFASCFSPYPTPQMFLYQSFMDKSFTSNFNLNYTHSYFLYIIIKCQKDLWWKSLLCAWVILFQWKLNSYSDI